MEPKQYDVLVIGAGHAGIEAALAAAKLGASTAVFVISMDSVGNLPCNPSIGGTAKGHLVCEIDALGGEMGHAADATLLQSRMLNLRKGPAVHSLRAQVDRRNYTTYMKHALEKQPGLDLIQAEIVSLTPLSGGGYRAVSHLDVEYDARCLILATGTYLRGRIYVGDVAYDSGPDGLFAATRLASSLKALNLPLRRFKTGTPARIHRDSIDFSKTQLQPGDEPVIPFSFDTGGGLRNTVHCHMTYTTPETAEIIRKNIHRSPLYSGKIEGIGTRYCPSIEDKIMRFPDKERHPVFLEPCGSQTEEIYVQGVSSSLPYDVQEQIYHSIIGLEKARIMRSAYAIEYDCVDPTSLLPTLESKSYPGLFCAGQICGSSGYEEAAAQGLVAGINAALKIRGEAPFVLERSSSYIGTLIDDLVTKGCTDPYRMMTSRSEYRLLLRQDNAPERLMPRGHAIGLVSSERYERLLARIEQKKRELERLENTILRPSPELDEILASRQSAPVKTGIRLAELLRRPELDYAALGAVDSQRPSLDERLIYQIETEIKYEGYIKRQESQLMELRRLEKRTLPEDVDYGAIPGLRIEAREKLQKIRPLNLGQASGISGVSPADLSVLIIWLKSRDAKEDS